MARKRSIRVGDRRGRIVVLEDHGNRLLVACDCGVTKDVGYSNVVTGRTLSCGCGQREAIAGPGSANYRHGRSRTAEHRIWVGMIARCENPRTRAYPRYGGRAIRVCDRWRGANGFANFLADMGPRPSPQHTIDRERNGGHYEPSNCRWATREEQAQNRRGVRFTAATVAEIRRAIDDGQSAWSVAREYGVPYPTIKDIASGRSWRNVTLT